MTVHSKRQSLCRIATSLTSLAALPVIWTTPIVKSVVLPAHANTSSEIPNSVVVVDRGRSSLRIPASKISYSCGMQVEVSLERYYVDDSGEIPLLIQDNALPNPGSASYIQFEQFETFGGALGIGTWARGVASFPRERVVSTVFAVSLNCETGKIVDFRSAIDRDPMSVPLDSTTGKIWIAMGDYSVDERGIYVTDFVLNPKT